MDDSVLENESKVIKSIKPVQMIFFHPQPSLAASQHSDHEEEVTGIFFCMKETTIQATSKSGRQEPSTGKVIKTTFDAEEKPMSELKQLENKVDIKVAGLKEAFSKHNHDINEAIKTVMPTLEVNTKIMKDTSKIPEAMVEEILQLRQAISTSKKMNLPSLEKRKNILPSSLLNQLSTKTTIYLGFHVNEKRKKIIIEEELRKSPQCGLDLEDSKSDNAQKIMEDHKRSILTVSVRRRCKEYQPSLTCQGRKSITEYHEAGFVVSFYY
ncbi:hypothetical protein L2E82_16986 [Cichorium intybus]|uniref:Uncharacterized protein n=1 Tax=Cichorium intybus TaxID=13427 RepID=A0ACB9F722_CICIN|nr:hypothetical protein L2E82_16986 [Cichorium intybus]